MGQKRRHHSVPKSILRFFRFNKSQLHYYEKADHGKGIQVRNPDSVFWHSHLYSLDKKQGGKDVTLEDQFAEKYDNKIRPVVYRRLMLSNSKILMKINQSERELLQSITINFFVRSKTTFEYLEQTPLHSLAKSVLTLADAIRPRSPYTAQSQAKELYLGVDSTNKFAKEFFSSFGMHYIIPEKKDQEFLIGSLPLCRFVPSYQEWEMHPLGKSEHRAEFILPLAPRLAVVFSGGKDSNIYLPVPSTEMDRVNTQIFNQSDAVAARSDLILRKHI